ncbi:MAG: LCP family protein [Gudongella sp.]|nr:LCP family protein [Gudongella sp.]
MNRSKKNNFFRTFAIALVFFISVLFLANTLLDKTEEHFRILVLGVDSKDYKLNKAVRSDTIMLVDLNSSSGVINIISIPRDTRTAINGRKNQEKINHSFAYGGAELTLETVSELLGIQIDNYIVVDYKAVREYIDLIGGVDLFVPMDMKYSDPVADPPLLIDLKEGQQNLDGDKALQYLRFRKGYKNADLGRIEAQQTFLKAMIKQSIKPSIIIKIPKMVNIYKENIETNLPVLSALKESFSFFRYDLENIESFTLKGTSKTIDGLSYYIVDKDELVELINNNILK